MTDRAAEPTTIGGGGCFTFSRNGERRTVPEKVAIWHQTCGVCIAAPFQSGDRIWVRETWCPANSDDGPCVLYRADGARWYPDYDGPDEGAGPSFNYDRYSAGKGAWASWANDVENGITKDWRSPIHMPRWASRLTLIVTAVKVERLQDISGEDAIAEGWFELHPGRWAIDPTDTIQFLNARSGFKFFWNHRQKHVDNLWSRNPWVVALTFNGNRHNIDAPAMVAA